MRLACYHPVAPPEGKSQSARPGPHYVLVATSDRKGLSSMDIVAVLTKVVQEQQKTIDAQQNKIDKLEQQQALISALYEKVNAMEKQMKLQGTVARVDY